MLPQAFRYLIPGTSYNPISVDTDTDESTQEIDDKYLRDEFIKLVKSASPKSQVVDPKQKNQFYTQVFKLM